MLNTLTKPRFQTFVKIFQGLTDRPTRLVLEAPPRSLKKKVVWWSTFEYTLDKQKIFDKN